MSPIEKLLLITLAAVPISVALTYVLSWAVGRFRSRRVVARMRAIGELDRSGQREAARAETEAWERSARPNDPGSRVSIAKVWWTLDEEERALSVLDSTTIPKSWLCRPVRRQADEIRFQLLTALGRHAEAEWFVRDRAGKDPKASWLVGARVELARRAGDAEALNTALHDAERVASVDPTNVAALAHSFLAAIERHRPADALPYFEQILSRFAEQERRGELWQQIPYKFYATLGTLRLASGDDAGAAIAFSEARARAPDTDDARAELKSGEGAGYLHALRVDEAAAAFEAALTIRDEAYVRRSLAECRRRLGDLDAATEHLAAARRLADDERRVRSIEARVLSDRARASDAEAVALEAVEAEADDDADSLYSLTYVRVMHALPDAEETLRRYVALVPQDPDLPALLDRPRPGGGTWRDVVRTADDPV